MCVVFRKILHLHENSLNVNFSFCSYIHVLHYIEIQCELTLNRCFAEAAEWNLFYLPKFLESRSVRIVLKRGFVDKKQ